MELSHDFGPSGGFDPAVQALQQAERLLDCWRQALGHELPNHFVAIVGLSHLLEGSQTDRLEEEGRVCLERLTAAARRGGRLVTALADLDRLCREARSEQGVSLVEVAHEAAAEVRLLCAEAVIEYDFQTDLPSLAVSRRALHQVLVHLLRNAVQAAVPSRPLRVEVGGRPHPDGVEWWVRDNGRGLSLIRPETLFDAFANPGRGSAGQGLGLFLVRQLIAAWHGALRVHSEPGEGTTFTLLVRNPQ
jgi:signal transduction histidine kinase